MNKNKNIINEEEIVKRKKNIKHRERASERANERVRHYASCSDFARATTVSLILATLHYIISYVTLFRTSLRNAGGGGGSKRLP